MEITLNEIKEKFESLPEDLKWAIMETKVDDKIVIIGPKHGLNVEQMGQLSLETHAVMFGLIPLNKFEESLEQSLRLPREKIQNIINDVNELILKDIRKNMMSLPINNPMKQNNLAENKILQSAGINIIPSSPGINSSQPAPSGNTREELLKKFEQPNVIPKDSAHPITEQKLSNSFQIPRSQSEYSPKNISKSGTDILQKTPGRPAGADPYREIPE